MCCRQGSGSLVNKSSILKLHPSHNSLSHIVYNSLNPHSQCSNRQEQWSKPRLLQHYKSLEDRLLEMRPLSGNYNPADTSCTTEQSPKNISLHYTVSSNYLWCLYTHNPLDKLYK